MGGSACAWVILSGMDVVSFTRQLIDIESITGNEAPIGEFLHGELQRMGYQSRKMLSKASASM